MIVTLRYFASVRELLARSREEINLPDGFSVAETMDCLGEQNPSLQPLLGSIIPMVNQEYVAHDQILEDGDELALIPPVSGGADSVSDFETPLFDVTTEPLDIGEITARVARPEAGATVTFTGYVRDHARGNDVVSLDYESYESAALKMLARIGDEVLLQWPDTLTAISHRTGLLSVGEISVVIAVSSPHREAAFEAGKFAIERIKEIVPIWKKEQYADGSQWIGSEADYQREIGRAPRS